MRKAGISDYEAFSRTFSARLKISPYRRGFSDDFAEMERQAMKIAGWGDNVYVKIPVTNTKREPCYALVKRLSNAGVKLNVTALMTIRKCAM